MKWFFDWTLLKKQRSHLGFDISTRLLKAFATNVGSKSLPFPLESEGIQGRVF